MRSAPRVLAFVASVGGLALVSAGDARAQAPASVATPPVTPAGTPASPEVEIRAEDVHLEGSTAGPATTLPEAPAEAPPPLPHHKGLVLEGSLGTIGFLGQFRHVAPPAVWLHAQLGWELTRWVMLFGEGELAFTDTSVGSSESQARAFPMFGFGGGARVTAHVTERVALWGQGSLGALKADVPRNALANLGYRDAESLGLSIHGRLGVDWYQLDRHMALSLAIGVRDASGFAKSAQKSDTPLMADASVAIRYTF